MVVNICVIIGFVLIGTIATLLYLWYKKNSDVKYQMMLLKKEIECRPVRYVAIPDASKREDPFITEDCEYVYTPDTFTITRKSMGTLNTTKKLLDAIEGIKLQAACEETSLAEKYNSVGIYGQPQHKKGVIYVSKDEFNCIDVKQVSMCAKFLKNDDGSYSVNGVEVRINGVR